MSTAGTGSTLLSHNGQEAMIRLGAKYIYEQKDWVKLLYGDPLPERRKKAQYILRVAWPVGIEHGDLELHNAIVMAAAVKLGWTGRYRPMNEFILVTYITNDGKDIKFIMPKCSILQQSNALINIVKG